MVDLCLNRYGGAGDWGLGAGSWELGAGSWELGAGSWGGFHDFTLEAIKQIIS